MFKNAKSSYKYISTICWLLSSLKVLIALSVVILGPDLSLFYFNSFFEKGCFILIYVDV